MTFAHKHSLLKYGKMKIRSIICCQSTSTSNNRTNPQHILSFKIQEFFFDLPNHTSQQKKKHFLFEMYLMYYTLFQVYRGLILLDFNSSVQSLPFQLIYTHRKFGCTSFKYITRTEKNKEENCRRKIYSKHIHILYTIINALQSHV